MFIGTTQPIFSQDGEEEPVFSGTTQPNIKRENYSMCTPLKESSVPTLETSRTVCHAFQNSIDCVSSIILL